MLYPLRLQVAEARERRRLQQEHEDRENALLRHELAEEQRREQAQKVNSHETRGGSPVHVGILCNAGVQLRQHQLEADGLHIRLSYTIERDAPWSVALRESVGSGHRQRQRLLMCEVPWLCWALCLAQRAAARGDFWPFRQWAVHMSIWGCQFDDARLAKATAHKHCRPGRPSGVGCRGRL